MNGQPSKNKSSAPAAPQAAHQRSRPGFVVLLVCGLTAALIGLRWFNHRPPAPSPMEETAPVENTKPMAHVAPVQTVQPAPVRPTPVEEQWGIRVSRIRMTQADAAVDLSYEVVAPEKAALLLTNPGAPYLIDQASGTQLPLLPAPQTGAWSKNVRSRTAARMMQQAGEFPPPPNRLVAGKTYSLLLPNMEGLVRSGSKVVLVVGDYRTDALTVE